jgi:hypothetical protein
MVVNMVFHASNVFLVPQVSSRKSLSYNSHLAFISNHTSHLLNSFYITNALAYQIPLTAAEVGSFA